MFSIAHSFPTIRRRSYAAGRRPKRILSTLSEAIFKFPERNHREIDDFRTDEHGEMMAKAILQVLHLVSPRKFGVSTFHATLGTVRFLIGGDN